MTDCGETPCGGGTFLGKAAGVVTGGALYVVIFGMVLAWGSALVHWVGTVGTWTGWEWAGAAAGLAWAGLCVWGLGVYGRRWNDSTFLAVAVGVALAAGLAWALGTRGMERWPMDSGYFRWFLEQLAEGGWSAKTLEKLAHSYDYGAWSARAWPIYYPLRLLVGAEYFGVSVQMLQAVIGALGVVLSWRTATLLAGQKVARWAVVGWISMPGSAMQAVGMNHQVLGACGFLAAMWLLAEWRFGGGGWRKKCFLFVGAFVVAAATCFESTWSLYLLGATALLVLEFARSDVRKWGVAVAFVAMVLVPAIVAKGVVRTVLAPAREANPSSMNGGSLAFAARGWDMQWGGEYSDAMQVLDELTPIDQKSRFFKSFLASQCVYNGKTVAGKLFPTKLAKFLLLGYASLGEEVLSANGADEVACAARGARVAWFLVFGVLGVVGLKMMDKRALEARGGWKVAWLVLPVAMFAVAVVLAGETSPRYSMPVQPLLFAVAAWGLCEEGAKRKWGIIDKNAGFPGFVAAVAGCALVVGVVAGGSGLWARWALLDMREAAMEGGETVSDGAQAPYEARFHGGGGSVIWPGEGGAVAAYVWGAGWRDKGEVEVRIGDGGEWRRARLPMRIVAAWRDGEKRQLALRRADGKPSLAVGYASETAERGMAVGAGEVSPGAVAR